MTVVRGDHDATPSFGERFRPHLDDACLGLKRTDITSRAFEIKARSNGTSSAEISCSPLRHESTTRKQHQVIADSLDFREIVAREENGVLATQGLHKSAERLRSHGIEARRWFIQNHDSG